MVMLALSNSRGRGESQGAPRLWAVLAILLFLIGSALPAAAAVDDPFPDAGPATRAAAVALVSGETTSPSGCLTPKSLPLKPSMTPTIALSSPSMNVSFTGNNRPLSLDQRQSIVITLPIPCPNPKV